MQSEAPLLKAQFVLSSTTDPFPSSSPKTKPIGLPSNVPPQVPLQASPYIQ